MVNLRAMDRDSESERAFICKSWVESFKTSALARLVSQGGITHEESRAWEPSLGYFVTWNALASSLVTRSRVRVADDEGVIAGFMVWEPWDSSHVVHYVYVRPAYRGKGVARSLLNEVPAGTTYFTHRSRGLRRIPPGFIFTLAPLFGAVEVL